jgi:hypothetical protein
MPLDLLAQLQAAVAPRVHHTRRRRVAAPGCILRAHQHVSLELREQIAAEWATVGRRLAGCWQGTTAYLRAVGKSFIEPRRSGDSGLAARCRRTTPPRWVTLQAKPRSAEAWRRAGAA